jgi:hypothetical protein
MHAGARREPVRKAQASTSTFAATGSAANARDVLRYRFSTPALNVNSFDHANRYQYDRSS